MKLVSAAEYAKSLDAQREESFETGKVTTPEVNRYAVEVRASIVFYVETTGDASDTDEVLELIGELEDDARTLLKHFGRERKNPLLVQLGKSLTLRVR